MNDPLDSAAEALRSASSIIVGAGAGMGVDSGLPDFRGPQGFWRAYPPMGKLGLHFEECANPAFFESRPALAWGFYAHRLLLYRSTKPHGGFQAIQDIAKRLKVPRFVVTSNVDGQFQRAGFSPDMIYEIHGSIHHLQCARPCRSAIWENDEDLSVDEESMELVRAQPACRHCSGLARPNILMFGDGQWVSDRSHAQGTRYSSFLRDEAGETPVYIEVGAGTNVPSIRHEGWRLAGRGATVVRVNLRDADIESPHVGVPMGALEALQGMLQRLE